MCVWETERERTYMRIERITITTMAIQNFPHETQNTSHDIMYTHTAVVHTNTIHSIHQFNTDHRRTYPYPVHC